MRMEELKLFPRMHIEPIYRRKWMETSTRKWILWRLLRPEIMA